MIEQGYRPEGKNTSKESIPLNGGSAIQENKSLGELIDLCFKSPSITLKMCSDILRKTKEELEKVENENKKLKEQIIEKDQYIEYINGKLEGMEYAIEHLKK